MKLKTLFKAPFLVNCGYGAHSRQLLKALLTDPTFDVYLENINWGNCSFLSEDTEEKRIIKQLIAKRVAVSKNGQENWDLFLHLTIPNEFEKRAKFNVGITAGIETDMVSHVWVQKSNEMDLIIVPSGHSKASFMNTVVDWQNEQTGQKGSFKLEKPIFVCPEGVDTNYFTKKDYSNVLSVNSYLDSIESDFNFLCVGQWSKGSLGEDRKNIGLTIKLFIDQFLGRKDVGLILKTNQGRNTIPDCENIVSILKNIKSHYSEDLVPPIYLIHSNFTNEEMAALYNHPKVKCMVSFTHGEGFGLPLIEAAACELPVIATNWSGHLDFLKQGKFSAVSYELSPIPESVVWQDILIKNSKWANIVEDSAKHRMVKMVNSYQKPLEWAKELGQEVRKDFNLEEIGKKFIDTLKQNLVTKALDKIDPIENLKIYVDTPDDFNVLYTMPMSMGDVFISTAVIDGLKHNLPENSKIYFATSAKYSDILTGNKDIYKVIPWDQSMMFTELMEEVFDLVLTPNVATQFTFSNWVRGGKGRLIAEEFANHCQCELGEYKIEEDATIFESELKDVNYITFHPGSGKEQWSARKYYDWNEFLLNIKEFCPSIKVVQIGQQSEEKSDHTDVDLRGRTSPQQLASVLKNALVHIGIDSFPMHLSVAMKTPVVAIFGSSTAKATGPWTRDKVPFYLIEAQNRMGVCKKPCYKNECKHNKHQSCINEIDSFDIFCACAKLLKNGKNFTQEENKTAEQDGPSSDWC